jgi:predicted DNA-binding transcriptional regulator YafY
MPKKSEVFSRAAWQRMMKMHELIQSRAYPTCKQIATEFEVQIRTIKRDVLFMKDRLNLPIEHDRKQGGYIYTRPVHKFPSIDVTEGELFALLVAEKAIAQYRGTPFQMPLQAAFKRFTSQLDDRTRFTLDDIESVLSFRPFAPEDTDLENFSVLTRAIQKRRVVQFTYRNLGSTKPQQRTVRPYHLGCIDNHWYLFAFDITRDDIRTFALTRLTNPKLTGEKFAAPKDFNPAEYLRSSFVAFKGAQDYEVVIEFDAWASDLIRGRTWHASQQIVELPGGGIRFTMRVDSLQEADRWVLSWGSRANVIRPQALIDRIRTTAAELVTRYTNDTEPMEPKIEPAHRTATLFDQLSWGPAVGPRPARTTANHN